MGLFPHSFLSFFPRRGRRTCHYLQEVRNTGDFPHSRSLSPRSCADPDHLSVRAGEKALGPVVHGTGAPQPTCLLFELTSRVSLVCPRHLHRIATSPRAGRSLFFSFLWSLWLDEAQSLPRFPHYWIWLSAHIICLNEEEITLSPCVSLWGLP